MRSIHKALSEFTYRIWFVLLAARTNVIKKFHDPFEAQIAQMLRLNYV